MNLKLVTATSLKDVVLHDGSEEAHMTQLDRFAAADSDTSA